jgi:hypothetical protein
VHVTVARRRLTIRVDAAGARYPVKVDPLLTPSTGDGITTNFGAAVASSGTTVVVGAPSGTSANHQGAAYVFVKPSTGWQSATQSAKLTPKSPASNNGFGAQVAVSGSTIAIGATGIDEVYVFSEPPAGWDADPSLDESADLVPPSNDSFGDLPDELATDGLTVAIGAPYDNNSQGDVFAYSETGGKWTSTPTATLSPPTSTTDVELGQAVAMSASDIVASAPAGGTDDSGAVMVFPASSGTWKSTTGTIQLTAAEPVSSAELGESLAYSGSTIVAGAPSQNSGAGAAYVFTEPTSGGWASAADGSELSPSSPQPNDDFGEDVAIDGSSVVVADYGVSTGSGRAVDSGIWEYEEPDTGWTDETAAPDLTYDDDSPTAPRRY